MSFSTGGLFTREARVIVSLYVDLRDWGLVRDQVLTGNLLQARTKSSLDRQCREVIGRLQTLGPDALQLLLAGSDQEQLALLWVAFCRRHKFVAVFASEVIRDRYVSLKGNLSYEDYDHFYNRQADWHVELDAMSAATRKKLRQVLFKILHEAGILSADNIIQPAILSPRVVQVIVQQGADDLLCFPLFDSDLKGISA